MRVIGPPGSAQRAGRDLQNFVADTFKDEDLEEVLQRMEEEGFGLRTYFSIDHDDG